MSDLAPANPPPPTAPKGMLRAAVGAGDGRIRSVFRQIATMPGACRVQLPGGSDPGLTSVEVPLPATEGTGSWRLIAMGEELLATVTDCTFNSERRGLVVADNLVELHLTLEGPVGLSVDGATERQARDVSLLACFPTEGFSYDIWCAPGSVRSLGLYVDPGYISGVCGLGTRNGTVLHRLLSAPPGTMNVFDHRMSVAFVDRLQQLFAMRVERAPDLLRTGAILLDFTCQVLSILDSMQDDGQTSHAFHSRDLALLAAARKALENDLAAEIPIAELARQLGTNATKLKNGFRLLYGMSLGGFRTRQRMECAMRMLARDKASVAAVAEAVGFRHQASLTVAFRAHFGITPRAARALEPTGET
ncbi:MULTISPECIES: AraC family transcriptional regulator [unclassified Chelatococcus]|uniref:helix-turn-helix domain-containing protein n=1 Tax=unclassified Chelatococcus TaxID=2638111 RepID=UPI001BCCF039|nr:MULTISPECIES: AraC family transcriptional regulator [unclassified Chelatococcus]CAH1653634.1 putative HTH araC/xylS-type domain-containing protein [Hyphomicrobiales bacterium]MBS7742875.1 helix-turn-helix transcriptional regulator [Chelatococcus sp. HY11]MBX3542007.1 helix-turn-helix transcriptional regulator [Chelatococcus sp.]MCO5074101.1 AraC family transcriptional regulator [Chelatococcus sp.]CAH1694534.1 putative HTH araC/xylS-type domain-containing protein [Hyphomicrobiales bacterium]